MTICTGDIPCKCVRCQHLAAEFATLLARTRSRGLPQTPAHATNAEVSGMFRVIAGSLPESGKHLHE